MHCTKKKLHVTLNIYKENTKLHFLQYYTHSGFIFLALRSVAGNVILLLNNKKENTSHICTSV